MHKLVAAVVTCLVAAGAAVGTAFGVVSALQATPEQPNDPLVEFHAPEPGESITPIPGHSSSPSTEGKPSPDASEEAEPSASGSEAPSGSSKPEQSDDPAAPGDGETSEQGAGNSEG